MSSVDRFVEAAGGSWTIGPRPGAATLAERLQSAGWTVAVIDGRRCPTKATLLAEIARVLQFPEWFGHNWDALVDCLRDTERLAIVVSHADRVGVEEHGAAALATLMSIVDELGEEGAVLKLAARVGNGVR
jgi:RNAse (barnase) inhibitor barstar